MREQLPDRLETGRITSGEFASHPSQGPYGAFDIPGPCGERLHIYASGGQLPEEQGWEHVSVSTRRRCPNWQEMCFVKDLFWSETECVIEYHVPAMHHINNHPYCLHLWRHKEQGIPMPPPEMVGIKNLDPDTARRVVQLENKKMALQGRRGINAVGIAAAMALGAMAKPGDK